MTLMIHSMALRAMLKALQTTGTILSKNHKTVCH
jgi:hypothetical protein